MGKKDWVGYTTSITLLIISIIFAGFSIAFMVYFARAETFANNNPPVEPPISAGTASFLWWISLIFLFISAGLAGYSIYLITRVGKQDYDPKKMVTGPTPRGGAAVGKKVNVGAKNKIDITYTQASLIAKGECSKIDNQALKENCLQASDIYSNIQESDTAEEIYDQVFRGTNLVSGDKKEILRIIQGKLKSKKVNGAGGGSSGTTPTTGRRRGDNFAGFASDPRVLLKED